MSVNCAESAAAVADAVGLTWALVYQSRSGRPSDPWLEPDVCEYLRREKAGGLEAVDPLPDRLRVRSHRGAVRPRSRSRRCVPRDRSADGPRRGGQRRSAFPRHDGRRRPRHDRLVRRRPAAADRRALTRVTQLPHSQRANSQLFRLGTWDLGLGTWDLGVVKRDPSCGARGGRRRTGRGGTRRRWSPGRRRARYPAASTHGQA